VNLSEAKAQFSALVERAEAGEEVTILRHGRAVAKLVPVDGPRKGISPELLQRLRDLRASMPMYEDPDGLSFVERMRREDLL
jgi:prevent-host-death family protein